MLLCKNNVNCGRMAKKLFKLNYTRENLELLRNKSSEHNILSNEDINLFESSKANGEAVYSSLY